LPRLSHWQIGGHHHLWHRGGHHHTHLSLFSLPMKKVAREEYNGYVVIIHLYKSQLYKGIETGGVTPLVVPVYSPPPVFFFHVFAFMVSVFFILQDSVVFAFQDFVVFAIKESVVLALEFCRLCFKGSVLWPSKIQSSLSFMFLFSKPSRILSPLPSMILSSSPSKFLSVAFKDSVVFSFKDSAALPSRILTPLFWSIMSSLPSRSLSSLPWQILSSMPSLILPS